MLVLISHSFPLSGTIDDSRWLFMGYDGAVIAVATFFFISGFLVTASLERRTPLQFVVARFRRIVPGLAVVSISTAFLLGPIVTDLSLREYFSDETTYRYLRNAFPYQTEFFLPGVFKSLPLAGGVNGSLWTIPIEVFCYTCLLFIYILSGRSFRFIRDLFVVAASLVLVQAAVGPLPPVILFGTTELGPAVKYGLFFLIGSLCWTNRYRIPMDWRLAVAFGTVFVFGRNIVSDHVALAVSLPYLILYAAYRKPILQRQISELGDLSYGVYLIAFPVQQTTVWLFGSSIGGWTLTAIALPIVLSLSWLSWHFVELPAMGRRSVAPTTDPNRSAVRSSAVSEDESDLVTTGCRSSTIRNRGTYT